MANKNVEGITSTHVPDSTKILCPRCNSSLLYLSSTLDDPNDITKDLIFAALLLSITDGSIQGLVALCHNCGNEFVPLWYLLDTGTAAVGGAVTMTNLDQATTADLMAGLYAIPMVGTDVGKYFIIASNTAVAPTVITMTVAPNADSDGIWMITNILPLGLTLAS